MLGANNTTFKVKGLNVSVVFYQTEIIKATSKKILLDTGGFRTATTKRRMNQAADQFGLGFEVTQKRGEWYVTAVNGERTIFQNGQAKISR